MKKRKIITGVATAAIVTPIVAQASGIKDLNIIDKILLSDQLPIQIQTGIPVRTKTGNVYNGNFNGYVPCNRVASNNNNVTNGVNVTYAIPISIHSTNGKTFNIPDVEVTANPVIKYNGPVTPEKEKVAAEIAHDIKVQVASQSKVNSSYSGKLNLTLNIGPVDWGMTITPNIQVKCGDITHDVEVAPLKTTKQYVNNVSATATTPNSEGYFGINVVENHPAPNDWIYNDSNNPPKLITFNIGIKGDNGAIELNPEYANNPDIKYDPATGNCTVIGKLATDNKVINNLFKINSKDAALMINSQINVNATNIEYTNPINQEVPGLVTTTYSGNSKNYQHVDPVYPVNNGTQGSTVVPVTIQNINTASNQGVTSELPIVTATSNVSDTLTNNAGNEGFNTNWKFFGALFTPGSKMLYKSGPAFNGSNLDGTYVHLPQNLYNILLTGTPEQKYDLMRSLTDPSVPRPAGVEMVSVRKQMFFGATMPKGGVNFILYPLEQSGSNNNWTGAFSIPAMPTEKTEGIVLGKTLTFGYLPKGGGNPNGIVSLNPNTDYLSKGSDGKVNGFIAGDDNNITESAIQSGKVFGFNNGIGQATSARTGVISHNSSSDTINKDVDTSVTIDGNYSHTDNSSWLDRSHTIEGNVNAPYFGTSGVYQKGAVITFKFSTDKFVLTSPIKIGNSTVIPLKDVTINGSTVSFKAPEGVVVGVNSAIRFNVKFTDPLAQDISVNFLVNGSKDNPTGIEYPDLNGVTEPFSAVSNAIMRTRTASETLTFTTNNGCLHYDDGVTSNNTSTMTAMIQNASDASKQYLGIIQIPTASSKSLAGNQGQPSVGGLSAELSKIDTNNCPIYVLPKSALDNTAIPGGLQSNEQMINSTNSFDMQGYANAIKSGKTGWIKYTPGMDLSNIVAIAPMPIVPAHSIYKFNYGLTLKGVKNGTFQYASSEFKYWDVTDGVGSISNVVTLAPNGVDLSHLWASTVVLQEDGSTRELTPDELKQSITFTFDNPITGKPQVMTEPLSYLIAHGKDVDSNYDMTPADPDNHLQQNVNLAYDEAGLKAAGYELVKTTVKIGSGSAADVNENYFTNTGIAFNTEFTKVVFVLKKLNPKVQDSVIVQVKTGENNGVPVYSNVVEGGDGYLPPADGKPGTKAQQGVAGVPLTGESGVQTPNIPVGYKIDGVIVKTQNKDGSWTSTNEGADFKVPTNLGSTNTQYVYQISKLGDVKDTLVVKVLKPGTTNTYETVEVGQGGYVAPQTGTAGIPNYGASGISNPVIPPHYKIDSIELNGKIIASTPAEIKSITSSIPTKLGSDDANYVYNISPIYGNVTTQVVVVNSDGTVIANDPATQEQKVVQGAEGTTFEGTPFDKNSVDTITIDGHTINLSSPDVNQTLQKYGYALKVTGDVNPITMQTPTNEHPINTTMTTINSSKIVAGSTHLVYTLTKLPMYGGVTLTVENLSGTEYDQPQHEVQRAVVGTNFSDAVKFSVPDGYSLVSATLNGTKLTNEQIANLTKNKIKEDKLNPYDSDASTTTAEMAGDQHVVYTIVKNVQDTVRVLVDGKPITTEVANKSKNPKSVENQNGPAGIPAVKGATPGDSGIITPVIPEGYKITSITLNGKPLTENGKPVTDLAGYTLPGKLSSEDQNFVYNISKIEPVTVQVITVDKNGSSDGVKQLTTTTTNHVSVGNTAVNVQNGIATDTINGVDTGINVPDGYHIVSMTFNNTAITPKVVDGKNVWNLPQGATVGKDGSKIVYKIAKNNYKTVVTVTDGSGTPVTGVTIPPIIDTPNGGTVAGTSTTVKIPNGWKIVKVTTGTGLVPPTNGGGTPVTPIVTPNTSTGGVDAHTPNITNVTSDHYVHYVIEKVGNVTVTVMIKNKDGKLVPFIENGYNGTEHVVEPDTSEGLGKDITGTSITVPKGYGLVETTIQTPSDKIAKRVSDVKVTDGKTSSATISGTDLEQGTTKVVYVIKQLTGDITTTVVGPNGKTFKGNPPIKGSGNDGDVIPNDKTTITPPPGYKVTTVTVNGGTPITPVKNPNGSYSVPPMHYTDGSQNVVYHVVPEVGSVDVTVKDITTGAIIKMPLNGKEVDVTPTVSNQDIVDAEGKAVALSGYELTLAMKDQLKKDGYEIVPVKETVQLNTGTITPTTQADLAKNKLVEGTTHIVYYVKKLPTYGGVTVTVNQVVKENDKYKVVKVLTPENEVQRSTVNTIFSSATAFKPVAGFTLVPSETTLNGSKTTAEDIAKATIKEDTLNPYDSDHSTTTAEMAGDQHIVYNVVANVHDTVTVLVDGKPMTTAISKLLGAKNLMPQTGNEGTPDGYGVPAGASDVQTPVIPKGYKITSLTIDTLGADGKTVTTSVKATEVKGELVIPVKQKDGTTKNVPVSQYTIPTTLGHNDTHFIYNITKEEKVKVKVVTSDGTPITTTTTNNVKVGSSDFTNVQNGLATDLLKPKDTGINVPNGYHISGITINGTEVKPNADGKYVVPTTDKIGTNGTKIVYTLTKNAYQTVVTVTDGSGKKVIGVTIPPVINTPNGGTVAGTSTTVKIPNGWKIVKVTTGTGLVPPTNGGGTPVTPTVTPNTSTGGVDAHTPNITNVTSDHYVHYVIEKVGNVTVTVMIKNKDGKLVPFTENGYNGTEHVVEPDTSEGLGKDITGTSITVPKGYGLVETTIQTPSDKIAKRVSDVKVTDGKTSSATISGTDLEQGTTKVVYVIKQLTGDITTTVVGPNGKTFKGNPPIKGSGNDGDVIPNDKTTITPPPGYKVTTVTVNGGTPITPVKNPNGSYSVPPMHYTDGSQNVVYHVVPEVGSVDVTVKDITTGAVIKMPLNGKEVDVTPTVSNQDIVDAEGKAVALSGYELTPAMIAQLKEDGYEIVPVKETVQLNTGTITPTTQADLAKNKLVEGTTHIVYYVKKEAPKTGIVTVEVDVDGQSTPLVPSHEVASGDVGTAIDSSSTAYVIPNGYEISGTPTVDGVAVKVKITTKDGVTTINVPDGNFKDGTTSIVYHLKKKPVAPKTGNVVITINEVDANGKIVKTVVKDHSVMGESPVGTEITGANYSNIKSLVPAGYSLVSSSLSKGANASIDNGVVTGQVVSGTTEVIYNITKDTPTPPVAPKTGTVDVKIVTDNGKVLYTGKPDTGNVGTSISAGDTAYINQPGYHVTGLTVNGTVVKSVDGAYKVPSMSFTDGAQHVVWIVSKDTPKPIPQPKTGNVAVTINVVDANGNVISTLVNNKVVMKKATVGSTITGANYDTVATANNIPAGYHLVKTVVTSPNGKTETYTVGVVAGTVQEGTIHVVYSIEKDTPKPPVKPDVKYGNVKVEVVTTDGKVLVNNHTVATDVVGTKVSSGLGYTNIPGYTLTGTTIDNIQKGAVSVSSVTLVNGTTQIIYTVTKNPTPPVKPTEKTGSVKVEVVTTDGKVVVPNHTVTTGSVGAEVTTGIGYTDIPGYHLVKTTVDGTDKGASSITGVTLTNGTTQIIYTIEKDPTPPTPVNPPAKETGKVTVTVVTSDGTIVVKTHTVTEGVVGGDVTGTGYNPPKGYKITKITVDGTSVSKVPSMKIPNGTTSIVYTITKIPNEPDTKPDVKPEPKYGNVTVKVVTESGEVVVGEHEVGTGLVGSKISKSATSYTVPDGYHLVKETIDGKDVSSNPDITLTDGTTRVVYIIAKNIVTPPVTPPVKPDSGNDIEVPQVKPDGGNNGNNGNIPSVVPPLTGDKTGTVVVTPNQPGNNTSNPNEIPVITVTSNKSSKIVTTLADTGTNPDNTGEDIGSLVGLVGLIGLGFLFKKKK